MFLESPLMLPVTAAVLGVVTIIFLWNKFRFMAVSCKEPLFSPEYRALLGQIDIAVRSHLIVFPKLPVRDVLVAKGGGLSKFIHQHFDFVICHRRTMDVLCVVSMAESRENKADIKGLRTLCEKAGLTMMEYDVKPYRDIPSLRREIFSACGIDEFELPAQPADSSQKPEENRPIKSAPMSPESNCPGPKCPKCHSDMKLQTINKGSHAGKQCWVCVGYPACKGARMVGTTTE